MKVRNKLESIQTIKNKRLNLFPEKLFYKYQTNEILRFLDDILLNIMRFVVRKL